jgi:hypothetical protein
MQISPRWFKALDLTPTHLNKPKLSSFTAEKPIEDQVMLKKQANLPSLDYKKPKDPIIYSYTRFSDDINKAPQEIDGQELTKRLKQLIRSGYASPGKTLRAEREDRALRRAWEMMLAEKCKKVWNARQFYSTSALGTHRELCDVMSDASSEGKYHSSGFRATLSVIFGDTPIEISQHSSNKAEKERLYNFGDSKFRVLISGCDETDAFHAALEQAGRSKSAGKSGYTEALLDPEVKILNKTGLLY